MIKRHQKFNKNKGFTLVELIVVLVLLGILISLGVSGLLSWHDYSKFKQENTNAETIFYAVQNQFTEYSSSGVFDEKVTSLFKTEWHKLGDADKNPSNNLFLGDPNSSISYEEGKYYDWDEIWANTPDSSTGNTPAGSEKAYQGSIYYMSADKGDYDDYLNGTLPANKKDTKLLFDMLSTYISDKSVFNGSIWVEFSPEARQVFAVCYSDKADSFTKDKNPAAGATSVLKREETVRRDLMMGYYAVDTLSRPLKGRSKERSVAVDIRNEETLDLVFILDDYVEGNEYSVQLCKGAGGKIDRNTVLAEFNIKLDANKIGNSVWAAASNPTELEFSFNDNAELRNAYPSFAQNKQKFRVPVWKKDTIDGTEIHIVLDAADAQAQSYMYDLYTKGQDVYGGNFVNTFSFYRFGFNMDSLMEISARVKEKAGSNWSEYPDAESPVFASVDNKEGAIIYEISNGRHLYNVRFETDYKEQKANEADRTRVREFRLTNDIDWNIFIDKKRTSSSNRKNYYLNSCNASYISAGIGFDGRDYSINRVNSINPTMNSYDTTDYAFPGFKSLGINDTFSGKMIAENGEEAGGESGNENSVSDSGCYTISNLTITFAANMAYGVYGKDARDRWNRTGNYANTNNWPKYSLSDYGLYSEAATGKEKHPAHVGANKGLYPLGLFAENSGTIENLVLNSHRVIGMEVLKDSSNSDASAFVYTNMVGGFTGNNLGELKNLKLQCVDEDEKAENPDIIDSRANEAVDASGVPVTYVNGKTDVGGILGRQSWTATTGNTSVTLENLENYGRVTGMENVGGIVGRAYIIRDFYSDNKGNPRTEWLPFYESRFQCYTDGYDIYGTYTNGILDSGSQKGITGNVVYRVKKIKLLNCVSRGEIRGDDLIHEGNVVYCYEDRIFVVNANNNIELPNTDFSNTLLRCSNIGGIAGIAMDGFYTDYNNYNWYGSGTVRDGVNNIKAPQNNDGPDKWNMVIENCNAYRLYSPDELSVLQSSGSLADSKIRDMLQHDYYTGGLVGYSRLACTKDSGNAVSSEIDGSSIERGYKAFIFGRNYVGGLFGCFDTSLIKGSVVLGEKTYNIRNDNNVVGVMIVGGISGGLGIGDESQKYFSFRHPSSNEGSLVSQINGATSYSVQGMLNTGVVLGVKRKALDYTNLIKMQDMDIGYNQSNYSVDNMDQYNKGKLGQYAYQGLGIKKAYASPSGPDSYVGGIAGATRLYIVNSDNIQSTDTKNYALTLIGTSARCADEMSSDDMDSFRDSIWSGISDIWSDSIFGGNSVGGIAGKICEGAKVNASSKVDSIVFGADSTGGLVGSGVPGNDNDVYASLENAVIIGRDMVGGVEGNYIARIKNAVLDKDFSVFGRYAVGGAFGASNVNKELNVNIQAGYIRGKAYVGGYAGMVTTKSGNISGTVSNVTVKADFFAGGVVGAAYTSVNNNGNYNLNKINVQSSSMTIDAGAYAGGIIGLYAHHKEGANTQNYMVEWDDDYNYVSILGSSNLTDDQKAEKKSHNLVILAENLENCGSMAAVIDKVVYSEKNGVLSLGNQNPSVQTLSFNSGVLTGIETAGTSEKPVTTVTADVFAGGVFGYIPSGQKVTVNIGINDKNNSIKASVSTSTSVKASALCSAVNSDNGFDKYAEAGILNDAGFGDRAFSYAGGVIGRIPETVTIKAAAYSGVIKAGFGDNLSSYIGQITEVNAGTIATSRILNFNSSSSENAIKGGLTGLNTETSYVVGTGDEKNIIDTDTFNTSGSGAIGLFMGENWADYEDKTGSSGENRSLSGWKIECSDLTVSGGDYVGVIAGYNYGRVDIKKSEIKVKEFKDGSYVGAYFGANYGEIYNSDVEEYINGKVSAGLEYRYEMKNAIVNSDLSIDVVIKATNASIAGIICAENYGMIRDICISNGCSLNIVNAENSPCGHAGSVCGISSGAAALKRCINFMNVGDSESHINYAGGIAGLISNDNYTVAPDISRLDNHGNVFGRDAAGISATVTASEGYEVTVRDCINTGRINGSGYAAGIAVDCDNDDTLNKFVNIEKSRNYGMVTAASEGNSYGICYKCHSLSGCFEASGLNRVGDTSQISNISQCYYVDATDEVPVGVAVENPPEGIELTWPLKLNYYKESETDTRSLVYKTVTGGENPTEVWYWAGINDISFDPTTADSYTKFSEIDERFMALFH